MAVQPGSTIYARDVDSYLGVTKGNPIYATDINSYVSVTKGNPIYASEMNSAIEILSKKSIGGKIFYDAGANGATYTFYNSSGNVITDTSISGLQRAVSYTVKGKPYRDRYYVVYPNMLNSGNLAYWGFYYNADIKSSGGNIVNTGTDVGEGKPATRAILNYIDTYASSETPSANIPGSDISQASHNGYNLYKNCGTSYKYLWDVIRDVNNNSLEGHDDWFIPSLYEMYEMAESGVISNITASNHLWLGSALFSSIGAYMWYFNSASISNRHRYDALKCIVCRAF